MKLFVGIDWGSKNHTVCVLNAQGEKLLEREVRHHGDDVHEFISRLRELADDDMSTVAAAMEAPQGVMVEALLECGASVYSGVSENLCNLTEMGDPTSGAAIWIRPQSH
jgi:hypothetical protein